MGHFVVSAAVDVRVGKNIKQPAGRGEYRSIYIGSGHHVVVADVMVDGWIASYVFILIFWSRCCCCCLLPLLPTTSVLKRREMLGTSIAAVVLGYFYFCPLDCHASVMVVDCAAVETGRMLEK